MRIDAWQAPLLVMAGIIVVEFVVGSLLRRTPMSPRWRAVRTVALLLLASLVVAVAVIALGPSLADQLASVAAAVAAVVALWLTYRSYRTPTDGRSSSDSGDSVEG
jgi:peptidoglycan/LPS O-acetylase OafA/YrhL